jgi:methyl coenzyme M reductase subunit C
MIEIKRPVSRRTRSAYNVLYRHKPRQIVVSLMPGDLLEFRELGCRHRWQMPVDAAFRIALRTQIEADRRAKREARRNK